MPIIRYGIGLDVSMERIDACLSTIDTAQVVMVKATCSFSNTKNGFQQLLKWAMAPKTYSVPRLFLMEATGIYYEGLAHYLHAHQCNVCVVLPNKAKKYKQALGLRSKTDSIDARSLSRMICEQSLPLWKPAEKIMYLLKGLTRERQTLTDNITRVKNQLHAQSFAMYKNMPVLRCLQTQVRLLQKQKERLEEHILELIDSDEELKEKCENICRLKGLGKLSLAVIIAETNGFTYFENVRQLVSYAGYDVVEDQSGKHKGKTKISKQGNGRIRRVLHLPAFNVVRLKQKPFSQLYDRLYERSRLKMKAYTAVQKKLLIFIYTLWKKNEAYDPAYKPTSGEMEPALSFASSPSAEPMKKK